MIRNAKPSLPNLTEIDVQLQDILNTGKLTNFGNYSKELEVAIKKYLGVKYCLCVSSATTGLMMVGSTLRKNTEVIVPSFTFLPTVQTLSWNGITPVFADIDPQTYTVSLESIKDKITNRTSAILAVHPFGNPCDVRELENIANHNGIKLLFDSAHAFGSRYCGIPIGHFGDAEVFSFSATKLLPCGEGGAIVTDNEDLYFSLLDRRNYGFKYKEYNCNNLGLNGKMAEFSAILGLYGLNYLDNEIKKRNEIASRYRAYLENVVGIGFQRILGRNSSVYKDFTITISKDIYSYDKIEILGEYADAGIEVKSYFSPCIHQMDFYKSYSTNSLPNTEIVEKTIFSLPIYSSLTKSQVRYISDVTKEILNKRLTR